MTSTKDENEDENEDERRKRRSKKRTVERRKLIFKTNVLVPKTNSMRKEEGATVAATPYLLLSKTVRAVSTVGPDGQYTETSPNHWERLIKYHKCPTFDANRNAGDFQSSDWPSNYR